MSSTFERAQRLAVLAKWVHVSSNLAIWCYSTEGDLMFSTSPNSKELGTFFEIGGCKEYAMTVGQGLDKPFIMSDELGFVWVGEFSEVSRDFRALVLMGPVFPSEISMQSIEDRMRRQNMAPSLYGLIRQVLTQVPVFPANILNQYIRLLHFVITSKYIQPEDYVYQKQELPEPVPIPSQETGGKHFIDYENAYQRELLTLQCIREGNLHYQEVLERFSTQPPFEDSKLSDPIRETKNGLIIFASKCCQAAIEGKLPINTAKEIENRAIQRIEKCLRLTDLYPLYGQILEEFVRRVHQRKENYGISQPVLMCCDYVRAHFMEPIELADIAKAVCYSEYYLSRKFHNEMGLQLREYIRNVRLEYAKIWLISTEMSVTEISEQLQFGTRNYFTRVFREQEGITPTEFRDRARMVLPNTR